MKHHRRHFFAVLQVKHTMIKLFNVHKARCKENDSTLDGDDNPNSKNTYLNSLFAKNRSMFQRIVRGKKSLETYKHQGVN
jgi:hypothetical protein